MPPSILYNWILCYQVHQLIIQYGIQIKKINVSFPIIYPQKIAYIIPFMDFTYSFTTTDKSMELEINFLISHGKSKHPKYNLIAG